MNKIVFVLLSAVAALTASAQEADTTIVLNYGYQAVDTISISKSSDTFLQIQEAQATIQGITDPIAKNRAIKTYVANHPNSDGCMILMSELVGVRNGKKCLEMMGEQVRNGLMKRLYNAYTQGLKEFDEMASKTAEACPIGQEAKDFTLEDINGQQLSLSSLRGRYVLIDFWGSWCGPCITSFPHTKEIYERYRNKLEILGVAIHDKKAKWQQAVKENELPWKLVIDTEGNDSVATKYGIVAAPTLVLLDPDGKIIEWTLNDAVSIEELLMQ